jgi:hypothetical protein
MEIEISSLIMGFLFLATFFVPITWHQVSQKKKNKKLTSDLFESAHKHNLSISQSDVWKEKYGIGIDENSQFILYIKKQPPSEGNIEKLIAIKEISGCKPLIVSRDVKGAKGHLSIIDKIGLKISFLKSNQPDITLEFFQDLVGNTQTIEHDLVKKWAGVIQSTIDQTSV